MFTSPQYLVRGLRHRGSGLLRAAAPRQPYSSEVFLNGATTMYAEQMFEEWKKDPSAVHSSWNTFFSIQSKGVDSSNIQISPPSSGNLTCIPRIQIDGEQDIRQSESVLTEMKCREMLEYFVSYGHCYSQLDPLSLGRVSLFTPDMEWLKSQMACGMDSLMVTKNLAPKCLQTLFSAASQLSIGELRIVLEKSFCKSIGYEFSHITCPIKREWLIEKALQVGSEQVLDTSQRLALMNDVVRAVSLEEFFQTKFPTEKRFGLDGGEALVAGMNHMFRSMVSISNVVIGISHRGRLNVCNNVLQQPLRTILPHFTSHEMPPKGMSGDVKYHLGVSNTVTINGKDIQMKMLPNPSHLEVVAPVVQGYSRAIQDQSGDSSNKTISILVHGDAAFSGQGIVYEIFSMSKLQNYSTGGCVHVIINNQIGFTTTPPDSRSYTYCTEAAKVVQAPVFHVNGDDVEAVAHVFQTAIEWKQRFHEDVVIDFVCYRRMGHNEIDEPMFTQPQMYRKIKAMAPVNSIYKAQLIKNGCLSEEKYKEMQKLVLEEYESEFVRAKNLPVEFSDLQVENWKTLPAVSRSGDQLLPATVTSIDASVAKKIVAKLIELPEGFKAHKAITRLYDARREILTSNAGFNFSTAEAIAYGSLLLEGSGIRHSGQDSQRGTFSQRHAVVYDQVTDKSFCPLMHLDPKQPSFLITNSPLSEFGVLGFDFGYSLVSPNNLVLWEAQFGDFANNAQAIVDTYISGAESKWGLRSGIVLLLPHGHDGMGPEHSDARIERYLQLCSDPFWVASQDQLYNSKKELLCSIQVAYPTTPANYFHLLRRQMKTPFRKPLVCFYSKANLRHPLAISFLKDICGNSHFQEVIDDAKLAGRGSKVTRVLLTHGQIYYRLLAERTKRKRDADVAIVRLEQFAPFPFAGISSILTGYPGADVFYVQEEHQNYGAWPHVSSRVNSVLASSTNHKNKTLQYIGRPVSSAAATGNKAQYVEEEASLQERAFSL